MPDSRFIVLTGATRGLGRVWADGFIAAGHTVAGSGRSREHVEALRKQHGSPHDWQVVDVADAASVDHWAKEVLAKHGPPDLLINNAAVINPNAPLWKVPASEFDHVIDVNIKGVANVIRAFVPAMVARKRGVIVNLSSGWGRSTAPDVAPYCTSKWAIEGMTQSLSQELPQGMAAVALSPGIIDTEMLRSTMGADAGAYESPRQWAEKAVPYVLGLGASDNGRAATVE